MRVRGFSDEEILSSLRIDQAQLKKLEETLLSEQAFEIATETPDRTYSKYRIEQRRNIRALDELIEELDSSSQYNAVIGAIRLRADLNDRIIKVGQELGSISKAATQHEHSHTGTLAHLVSQMTSADLRTNIKKLGEKTRVMVEAHGEESFLALSEGPIYYGETAEDVVDIPIINAPGPRSERPSKKKKKNGLARRRLAIS